MNQVERLKLRLAHTLRCGNLLHLHCVFLSCQQILTRFCLFRNGHVKVSVLSDELYLGGFYLLCTHAVLADVF